ncbi:2-oxoacid:acceptor oxidoreductase subunit alpha [Segatella albensis]|uniref:2-oxoacid:acceptor oxidoreductase subunit alpha n=1 Tax=Segatella albensis TaxID=77768 RepID=UPI00046AD5E9|nr:2-oxoacid:acceptor oxidoreductase subunit alpha [Segatella albensis]
MADGLRIKELDHVVVRFSGDSGDGMQLAGNIFSTVSAIVGNGVSTFPDYPADIRAPQGSLTGVSASQIQINDDSDQVLTPGDRCDVLIAMNAAALKTQIKYARAGAIIILDTDGFGTSNLEKAQISNPDYLEELGVDRDHVVACPMTQMVEECLKNTSMDHKSILKTRNMFALGVVCWLLHRDAHLVEDFLRKKFQKNPQLAENDIKVFMAGYHFAGNTHASVPATYRIDTRKKHPGRYMDITGNKALSYGLIAAAEQAKMRLFLGSYPITPASDILNELSKHKSLDVVTVQCEDEIAGCASAIGASFAGAMAVTSTSGPGICLKSEAMNLAVMDELPLVVIDVQRGGPSTGLPTKGEQTDLLQVLYGRNGESPVPVIAPVSPTDCFEAAYWACKTAVEHVTPVVILSDAYIANGSGAWRLPDIGQLASIHPHYAPKEMADHYTPYIRDEKTLARYWAIPGSWNNGSGKGFEHILGGLEKDSVTGEISNNPENHDKMVRLRAEKVARIPVSHVRIEGDEDAELLLVGFGGTYGHLYTAMRVLLGKGFAVALAQFKYINPLPANTQEILLKYKKVIVCEQNLGQFATYLRSKVDGFVPLQYNEVKGKPFVVSEIVDYCIKVLEE